MAILWCTVRCQVVTKAKQQIGNFFLKNSNYLQRKIQHFLQNLKNKLFITFKVDQRFILSGLPISHRHFQHSFILSDVAQDQFLVLYILWGFLLFQTFTKTGSFSDYQVNGQIACPNEVYFILSIQKNLTSVFSLLARVVKCSYLAFILEKTP